MAVSRKAYYTDQDGTTTEYVYGVDSDHVSIAGDTLTDKIDAVDTSLADLYNNKSDKQNSDGGFEGGENSSATFGSAVGNGASATSGGAVGSNASATIGGAVGTNAITSLGGAIGNNAASNGGGAVGSTAFADTGGAVGDNATTITGGAVGNDASATSGGAVGYSALTSSGFAGGHNAKTIDAEENAIDAIQLGTGTNSTEKTLQVYEYQLMDANGHIPSDRLQNESNGFAAGLTASTTSGGAIGNSTASFSGGAMGYGANTITGGAIGTDSSSSTGFAGGGQSETLIGGAIGYQAYANSGGAAGTNANTDNGGAIGNNAASNGGGAVGASTLAGDGFAGGYNAKTQTSSNDVIDAIQLGTGTNSTAKTLQVYDYQLMNADGNIPLARMSDNLPNIKKNSASTTGDIVTTHLTVGSRASGGSYGSRSFVSGYNSTASGSYTAVLGGSYNGASGSSSAVVGGYNNSASGQYAVTLGGRENTAKSNYSAVVGSYGSSAEYSYAAVVGGNGHTASGQYSTVVGGATNVASAWCSAVVGGQNNTNNGESSVILGGSRNTTSGYGCAVIASMENTALEQQIKSGHYATNGSAGAQSGTTGDAFIIGNGTSDTARSNAFRVTYSGHVYGKASFHSSGADYAEYFEWEDGNSNNEDRRGLFVTLDGDKIKIASPGDDIIGVVSAAPSVVGNTYDDEWQGKYKTDIFGQLITQVVHHDAVYSEIEVFDTDEDGKELDTKHTEQILVHEAYDAEEYVLSDDYDADQEYIPRSQRKEWAVVGMFGQIVMVDDGTCIVNRYCTVGNNGVATSSNTGYRVLKRIDETHVKVFVKSV